MVARLRGIQRCYYCRPASGEAGDGEGKKKWPKAGSGIPVEEGKQWGKKKKRGFPRKRGSPAITKGERLPS